MRFIIAVRFIFLGHFKVLYMTCTRITKKGKKDKKKFAKELSLKTPAKVSLSGSTE